MDFQKHFYEIETKGFTIVPGVISPEEAASYKTTLQQVLAEDWENFGDRRGKLKHLVVDLLSCHRDFYQLMDNEIMHRIFSHFLGDSCILYSFNSAIMPPEQKTSACEIHTDQNFFIPGYTARILMTLALDDFTKENGATYHLPGSQIHENPPSEDEFYQNAKRTVRKAGDAVFFISRNWHAGAVNHTPNTRYGLAMQATRHFMKQRLDYPRLVPPEVVPTLSSRAQRFLGFESRPPVSQEEFYLPEEQRGYK